MREIDGRWTYPERASFSTGDNNQAAFIAPDNRMYFSSTREGGQGRLDI